MGDGKLSRNRFAETYDFCGVVLGPDPVVGRRDAWLKVLFRLCGGKPGLALSQLMQGFIDGGFEGFPKEAPSITRPSKVPSIRMVRL